MLCCLFSRRDASLSSPCARAQRQRGESIPAPRWIAGRYRVKPQRHPRHKRPQSFLKSEPRSKRLDAIITWLSYRKEPRKRNATREAARHRRHRCQQLPQVHLLLRRRGLVRQCVSHQTCGSRADGPSTKATATPKNERRGNQQHVEELPGEVYGAKVAVAG